MGDFDKYLDSASDFVLKYSMWIKLGVVLGVVLILLIAFGLKVG